MGTAVYSVVTEKFKKDFHVIQNDVIRFPLAVITEEISRKIQNEM